MLATRAPVAAQPDSQRVQMFDATGGREMPIHGTPLVKSDPVAAAAMANAKKVDTFLRSKFGRNGWDDKGSPLQVVVHRPAEDGTPGLNNAFWDGKRVNLGDGDGELFRPLGYGLDVVAHEAMHGVVQAEVNFSYRGQQGALNESFSDVFAALLDTRDWTIGEDVFTPGRDGDAIRDLAKPAYADMRQLPKDVTEVHDLSGIPSLAAVKVAETVGRDAMGKIWYRALTEHVDPRHGFSGAARATLEAAQELFGDSSKEFSAVRDAWKAVGVRSRWGE